MDQGSIPVSDSDSLLRTLLASSGDCIKILDLDGNLIFMTASGLKIMEVTDFSTIKGCPWPDLWHDKGNLDAKAAMQSALRGETGHFQGFAATMADTPKWWDVTVTLIRDRAGAPDKLLCVSRDITAAHQAEQQLKANEQRFATFAQAMPNQVWSATPDGQLDWFNDQVFAYSGFTFDDLVGNKWTRMVHPDDIGAAAATWAKALSEGSAYETEFRLRRADDSFRWHLARALPIKDETGRIDRWIGTNTDISDLKNSEVQQDLLTRELDHRMKNMMAMIGAIATQTFRAAATKEEAQSVFNARLRAFNVAHDVLVGSSWTTAPMLTVVEGALAPHRNGDGRIRIDGAKVILTAKQALSLALALHELATNATKYGALSGPGGTIDVTWTYDIDDETSLLRFSWRESGGPEVAPPARRGFGSRLIESTLSSDFGGAVKMDYAPDGLVCEFETRLGERA